MARWMLNLDGGPKRVNHAAVAIGDKIYSFGGYTATEAGLHNDFIDVHVLNTFTYRWERLPILPLDVDGNKTKRSATISGPGPDEPSTSQSPLSRRRAHSLSELHPLAQILVANPPLLEDDEPFEQAIQSPRPENPENRIRREVREMNHVEQAMDISTLNGEEVQLDNEDSEVGSSQRNEIREIFAGIEQRLMPDNEEEGDFDYEVSTDATESADELMETDDEEEEEDEPRVLVRVEGLGELEVPVDMDLAELVKFQRNPEIPFKRYGHTVVAYRGQIYLWGGRNDTYGCRQTLHKYDPVHNLWSIVQSEGQCPPARDGHTAVVWGDTMYIFGGYEEREYRFSQESYAFHFPNATWTKLRTSGEPPQYRDFHAACVLDGKMFVFGGRSDEMGQSHTSHDLYDDQFRYLDLITHKWVPLHMKGKRAAPCGRRSHTMWTYQGQIYLFGGYQSIINRHFNDLWRFDPKTTEWTEIVPSGQVPSPRRRQCTVMVGNRLFLFGGTMPNPRKRITSNCLEDLGDLYMLDFSPTLASLCLQTILKHGLSEHVEGILPKMLNRELHFMSTPNQMSKPVYRLGTNMRG